ncbi:MAG: bifunctional metallophosphatase/5'-nucleotidase [Prevotella sp.]|nr:bifunctional metallophosphatase/5'-nucleotidase [Prevotella sp.]
MNSPKTVELRIIETSDVHGSFFSYNFIDRRPESGSLSRVMTYVDSLRREYGDNLLLFDNGDILQGQPTCYYCNYINPEMENVAASIVNYMGYDAQTIGNHDIETGHEVYDKWIKEVKCPMLGANLIDTKTGQPYLQPYAILNRENIKIAVLGMITPAIPNWLNENLWEGLRFEEIVESAAKWIQYLKSHEQPDIIIGLFHAGLQGGIVTSTYSENPVLEVAEKVDGFDLILYGHDHVRHCQTVISPNGSPVLLLNPSASAMLVGDAKISVTFLDNGKKQKKVSGCLRDIRNLEVDNKLEQHFKPAIDMVDEYVNRKVGVFKNAAYTRDCYFGNSAFSDFIHMLQLKITGADISFNAPLTFNTCIPAGDVFMSDMFNLYRYENQIYTMKLTGREILGHLEMSYDLWVNTMKSPDDHIMLLTENQTEGRRQVFFKNLAFNFDSAVGIDYEVDVTKPDGEKVNILRMSNGQPFQLDKFYTVAMNSYRGNGGGELLTRGAGIPQEQLKERILWMSERDQRYYLAHEISKMKMADPQPLNNWRFVPEEWTAKAIERDRALLFK